MIGVAFVSLLIAGCGSDDRPALGRVSGVVTIDGQPAAGIGVVFSQAGFRSSSGLTNDRGEYELQYLKGVRGAVLGEHRVRIESVGNEGDGPRLRIPRRYNRDTELTARVERGSNEFDFSLELGESR